MPPCNIAIDTCISCSPDRHNFVGPYVTSVGGTMGLPPAAEVGNFFSGGGFSYHFDRPDYQNFEVGNYIESIGDKNQGLYAFVLSCFLA